MGDRLYEAKHNEGYCHDPNALGLAEAALFDKRNGTERKLFMLRNNLMIFTDRFVAACCKRCLKHLLKLRIGNPFYREFTNNRF